MTPGVAKETTPSVWEWRKDASDVENIMPKVKKLKLSPKKPRPGSRFECVDEEEMSEICINGYMPPNTAKNTRWSLSVKWRPRTWLLQGQFQPFDLQRDVFNVAGILFVTSAEVRHSQTEGVVSFATPGVTVRG